MKKEIILKTKNKEIYLENGNTVKSFNESYPKTNILNEALNQARVEETDLNVPKILEVRMKDGKWEIVMDYIEGKTMAQLLEEQPDKTDELLEKMVDLQIDVHKKRVPMLPRLKDKMLDKIEKTSFDDVVKYELEMRINSMPKHVKLCHGDFTPDNIIVKENGEVFIVDWSHATQGNAACDVARTYLTFCLHGKEALAEKYVDMFCEKTATAKSYVKKLLPVVAASQSVKGHEEEIALLAKWVDVVEYE